MSALGHKQTFAWQKVMSALPPKADMCDVPPLNITKLAKSLPKSVKKSRGWEFRR
jgi:hypothetical protein